MSTAIHPYPSPPVKRRRPLDAYTPTECPSVTVYYRFNRGAPCQLIPGAGDEPSTVTIVKVMCANREALAWRKIVSDEEIEDRILARHPQF